MDQNMEIINKKNIKDIKFPLSLIYFYLTKGCNLCCRHCWIDPKYQTEDKKFSELSLDNFKSVIEQAKPLGLNGVKLTGGEPLMHSDIKSILKHIKKENLRLIVETNGTFCTHELVELIKECKNPYVSVSIDGANAETHEWIRGVKGCFNAAIKGIQKLVKAEVKTQIIMTIMKHNKNELQALVNLANSLNVHSVKFNITQPLGRGESMHKSSETLDISELISLGEWIEKNLIPGTDMKIYHSHPIAFRPLGRIFSEDGDGCSRCGIFNILGVISNGSYALCGIGELIPELVFGNVETDILYDIWTENSVLSEIRNGLPGFLGGICKDCLMKNICLGCCIAQNYFISKNLWAPFWYCQLAREEGFFPKTRQFSEDTKIDNEICE